MKTSIPVLRRSPFQSADMIWRVEKTDRVDEVEPNEAEADEIKEGSALTGSACRAGALTRDMVEAHIHFTPLVNGTTSTSKTPPRRHRPRCLKNQTARSHFYAVRSTSCRPRRNRALYRTTAIERTARIYETTATTRSQHPTNDMQQCLPSWQIMYKAY